MEISKIAKRWAPKIKHDLEQRYIALITNGVAEPAMTEELLRRAIDEAVKEKDDRIEFLETGTTELEGMIDKLTASSKEKNSRIEQLKSDIEDLQDEVTNLEGWDQGKP